MPLWGATDNAANSVKYGTELAGRPQGSGSTAKAANNTALYGNTSVGALGGSKMVSGQFSVSAAEIANTSGEGKKVAHTGWAIRKAFTGPVATIGFSVGGTGYSNTDLVRVSGGSVNAAGAVTTNSTGGLATLTLTNPGAGFINTSATTMAITNATNGATGGSGATLTFTLGGRAGRVQYETIVAIGPTSNGSTDDTQLPQ